MTALGRPMHKAWLPPEPVKNCELCGEPCRNPFEGVRTMHGHRECFLRDGIGGIGHLIAHDHWCGEPRNDPDAGLTYRQSALLCDAWVRVVGVSAEP